MKKEFKNIKTLLENGYKAVDLVIDDGKFSSISE